MRCCKVNKAATMASGACVETKWDQKCLSAKVSLEQDEEEYEKVLLSRSLFWD